VLVSAPRRNELLQAGPDLVPWGEKSAMTGVIANTRGRVRSPKRRSRGFLIHLIRGASRLIASQSDRIWSSLCDAVTVMRKRADPLATVG